MAKTIEELQALGLSKAEAERIVKRNAKAEEARNTAVARAKKRLPKVEAELAHATDRAEHWSAAATAASDKLDKLNAIIAGDDDSE